MSVCPTCSGRGVIEQGPVDGWCARCGGTGDDERPRCLRCGFKGFIMNRLETSTKVVTLCDRCFGLRRYGSTENPDA